MTSAASPHHLAGRVSVALIALAALCCSLSGCFPVIVGAAAYGSYAATDRRTLGAQTDDKVIAVRGDNDLDAEFGRAAHINVNVFNRRVLLTGQVLDEASKQRADQIMHAIPQVSEVINELMIAAPSGVGERSTDAYITASVKAALVNRSDIFANAYKVVTENSIVYLMGRVTHHEGDYGAEIARQQPHVLGVVKEFEYISDDELRRMQTQTIPPPNAEPPPEPSPAQPQAPSAGQPPGVPVGATTPAAQ
jgi:osmotically-inducible protein OsmY